MNKIYQMLVPFLTVLAPLSSSSDLLYYHYTTVLNNQGGYDTLRQTIAIWPTPNIPVEIQQRLTHFSGQGFKNRLLISNDAEELFAAGLYDQAAIYYKSLLQSIDHFSDKDQQHSYHVANWRLGLINHYFQDDQLALDYFHSAEMTPLATELPENIKKLQLHANYVEAVCCRNLKLYNEALASIEKYEARAQYAKRPVYPEASFEKALNLFHLAEYEKAKPLFTSIAAKQLPTISTKSKIYIGRIELIAKHHLEAERIFTELEQQLAANEMLSYELAFLRGENAFQQGNYSQAKEHFQRSIPQQPTQALWHFESLYQMGWCCLKQAERSAEQKPFFQAAKEYFRQANELSTNKERNFAHHLYLQGLNYYLHAAEISPFFPEQSEFLYSSSAEFFQQAFEQFKQIDPAAAAMAVKWRFQALIESNPADYSEALRAIETTLIGDKEAIGKSLEVSYLYGLAASRQAQLHKKSGDIEIAEKTLWKIVTDAPNSEFADASLHSLGMFYLELAQPAKSEEAFLHLIAHYPESQYAPGALYFCADHAEKMGKDRELIKSYWEQLHTNYPNSPYASAAFFHFYSYREYLQGERDALRHLKEFVQKYPNSPLQMTASYLTGLDYKRDRTNEEGRTLKRKNLLKAIDAFTDVEKQYELQRDQIQPWEFTYYTSLRYRAMLERAMVNHLIAEESQDAKRQIYLQYSQSILKQLHAELSAPSNFLAKALKEEEPFPRVHEESLYRLIQSYLYNNEIEAAESVISTTLERYHQLEIVRSYYLSRIHFEQGLLEMSRDQHEAAWQSFMRSEESSGGGKLLSSEQKLNLWIQQSLCYKALGQIDRAMVMLSKVINDDAISSLRIKAMLLRADIYELQGRPELSRKQLEAAASKGGEWAQKAKLKLDTLYGQQQHDK